MLKIKEGQKSYIILGAGGTGSWLASFLSKIDVDCMIVDGDVVEPKNVTRQNFTNNEVTKMKAEAIGDRYRIDFVTEFLSDSSVLEELIDTLPGTPVIVGCLDNNASRKLAHDVFMNAKYNDIYWVDAGNAERHGQVYVAVKEDGVVKYGSPIDIDEAFQNFEGDERRPDQISCAEHSESAPQNVTANITSATFIFDILNVINTSGMLFANKFQFNTASMTFASQMVS